MAQEVEHEHRRATSRFINHMQKCDDCHELTLAGKPDQYCVVGQELLDLMSVTAAALPRQIEGTE